MTSARGKLRLPDDEGVSSPMGEQEGTPAQRLEAAIPQRAKTASRGKAAKSKQAAVEEKTLPDTPVAEAMEAAMEATAEAEAEASNGKKKKPKASAKRAEDKQGLLNKAEEDWD